MKVLLLNDYGTPTGGAEVEALALRDQLRARGHDARLFASRARPVAGVRSAADYSCPGTTSPLRTLLQSANPWAAARLRRVLREFRPDVVHAKLFLTQLSPLILPLLRDVPSLYHAVWYRAVCPTGTKLLPNGRPCSSPVGVACYRAGCLPARDWAPLMLQMRLWWRWRDSFDLVVANSQATRRQLEAGGVRVDHVVPNGVPVRTPRPPLPGPPLVVFAGRLIREKGVDVLLRAFARVAPQVPAARLVIAGAGPERAALGALVDALSLGGRVDLVGHLPRASVEALFDRAWVQVVPSRWAEPSGVVAMEAAMRGTAVVASATGGLVETVAPGETGCLVPPGDADALAAALEWVLADRGLAERLGQAARRHALAHFGLAAYGDRFLDLYRQLQPVGAAR